MGGRYGPAFYRIDYIGIVVWSYRCQLGRAPTSGEMKGYTNVSGLKKDDKGVWRGTAMREGKSVDVSLDFEGNVVAK